MFSMAVWVAGLALEGLILVRAIRGRFLRKYSLFYLYLGWVFALSSVRLIIYLAEPAYYRVLFWCTQPLSFLMVCWLVLELFRQSFGRFSGAAVMAGRL